MTNDLKLRECLIAALADMNECGINQGTSGNISIRADDHMLISPSGIPYDKVEPEMIASIDLSGEMDCKWDGPCKPSVEWRFHWNILKFRPEIGAVVHAHPPYCTSLAILRQPIPACHYMIAAFGGIDVRCAGYATFGTPELAKLAVNALEDRTACLLANHGMIALGANIDQAMWRAIELETIARQYQMARLQGDPVLLTAEEIEQTIEAFKDYGPK